MVLVINKEVTLTINCSNDIKLAVRKNDKFTCNLLQIEYTLKATKKNKNKVNIEVDKLGLTNTGSLISKEKNLLLKETKNLK